MARLLFPSSFECDCGHKLHFFENTVRKAQADCLRRRKPIQLWDSAPEDHGIEFEAGRAIVVICPELGRCRIT